MPTNYRDYTIIHAYEDADFFTQWPKGENLQLLCMCEADKVYPGHNPGPFFFFPKDWDISGTIDSYNGHPMIYSPGFATVVEAMAAIDRWK